MNFAYCIPCALLPFNRHFSCLNYVFLLFACLIIAFDELASRPVSVIVSFQ